MQKGQSHKTDLQVQAVLIQKEVSDADGHDPHIVSAHLDIIPHDDNLLEGITDGVQRALFLLLFALGVHRKGGLNIILLASTGRDEVHLKLFFRRFILSVLTELFHKPYVYSVAPDPQLVIDDVLHDVVFFHLPKVQPCSPGRRPSDNPYTFLVSCR